MTLTSQTGYDVIRNASCKILLSVLILQKLNIQSLYEWNIKMYDQHNARSSLTDINTEILRRQVTRYVLNSKTYKN